MGLTIPVYGLEYPGAIRHQTRVAMSLVIVNEDTARNASVNQSLNVSNVSRYSANQSLAVIGKSINHLAQCVVTSHTGKSVAVHSILVGGPSKSRVAHSLDAVGGASFLIMADITAGIISQQTDPANNVQVIDLGNATAGTWLVWLNYGGYVLDTVALPFNATADDVKDALVDLDNVPNENCIFVMGGVGGPFTVEFEDEMGHRFINPLILDITNLTTDDGGVDVIVPGNPIGSFSGKEVTAELKVNNEIVEIKSFQYQEPINKLGAILNVTLARPDKNLVPIGSSIEFALVARVGESETRKILVKNGKMTGRDYRMSYRSGTGDNGGPLDEVTFSSIDVIADKFSLAPRRPIIMYDPAKVNFNDVQIRPRDAIVDKNGVPILPVYEPVYNLSMWTVLKRAYTNSGGRRWTTALPPAQVSPTLGQYLSSISNDQVGLGFTNVVTNIGNYFIKKADWGVDGSYHSGANAFVGMYNPMYIPILTFLYICWAEAPLPFGSLPRIVPMSKPKTLVETVPFQPDTNGVLVTYQVSALEDSFNNVSIVGGYEYSTDKSPTQDVITRTRYMRKVDNTTGEILAEVNDEVYVETRTDFGDGFKTLSHRETTQNFYYNDLKVGHKKDVYGLVLTGPDRSASLTHILTESCQSSWIDDPFNLGRKIMARNTIRVEGLCYKTGETVSQYNPSSGGDEDVDVIFPVAQAGESYLMESDNDDAEMTWRPIETTQESLRHIGGNQFDVSVVITNEITRGVKRSVTAPRTGDTSSNPYEVRAKTMLRRDLDSEALIGPRVPLSINTGELPRERAISLADLTLFRTHNPLGTFKMPLTEVDFGIAKGTVIIGQTRHGYTKRHIVVALDISGQSTPSPSIQMSVDGQELPDLS